MALGDLKKYALKTRHGIVMGAETAEAWEAHVDGKSFYTTISGRGAIPDEDPKETSYSVAVAPRAKEEIRAGLVNLIRERVFSDLVAVNALLDQMREDGVVDESAEVIVPDDVKERLVSMGWKRDAKKDC